MPPRHPQIAHALGLVRRRLEVLRTDAASGTARAATGERREPVGVLVACSGGPDSMALLGLLHALAGRDGLRLAVGHVDHGLRPGSADEAALVRRVAETLGVPALVTRLELHAGPGLPARARQARRDALRAQARQLHAPFVALGHT
ncbi:MAG: hypothetical protein KDK70_29890, partial [Myxococcales bacterium]|nr:hypothetical protein [Myxococcales bacterium]